MRRQASVSSRVYQCSPKLA